MRQRGVQLVGLGEEAVLGVVYHRGAEAQHGHGVQARQFGLGDKPCQRVDVATHRVAAQANGFQDRRAGAKHRIEHHVVRCRKAFDEARRQLRRELRRERMPAVRGAWTGCAVEVQVPAQEIAQRCQTLSICRYAAHMRHDATRCRARARFEAAAGDTVAGR